MMMCASLLSPPSWVGAPLGGLAPARGSGPAHEACAFCSRYSGRQRGAKSNAEVTRMVTEKVKALAAQTAGAVALAQ